MEHIPTLSLLILLAGSAAAQEVIEVAPLGISPAGEDYAPALTDSGFVMCSVRDASGAITYTDAETQKPLSELYWVPYKNGTPGTPIIFSSKLSTPVNEGPAAFTDDGKTICFTRNLTIPKKLTNTRNSSGELGLFFSRLENGIWTDPQPFVHNGTNYSVVHPTFSSDGNTLFFASNMEGGFGRMDLYSCTRNGDGWSAPRNLGPEVNGPSSELFPRMNADGYLYFASDRSGGLGKLDIYRSNYANGSPERSAALPAPINSAGNDHSITFLSNGHTALFTTDRDGQDAIWHMKRTVPRFRDCVAQQRNNYCYSFKRRPHAATSSIPVEHEWDMGDGTRIKGYTAQHCYTTPGHYLVRSVLVDRKSGEVFHTLSSNELEVADIAQAWIASQDTIRTGRSLELNAHMSHLPGMVPEEYHWDFGDGNVVQGPRQEHRFAQAGIYEVRLDVLALPDATGTIGHRCNTKTIVVIDRFKDNEDMTVLATYQDAFGNSHSFEYQELPFDLTTLEGESMDDVTFSVQLFASKERVDLDDARFVEVRKLYRVIERYDPITGMYTYSVGETKNAEELYAVFKKVKDLQFLDAEVFAMSEEKLMDLSQLDLASVEELNHKKLRTSAIHFAYKSAELQEESNLVLEQMIGLLRQHPELQLVIEAHTDDVGSAKYNMDLSQRRARSVMDHLVQHQVDPARLVPVGHGKNQPIASNRTEEGRGKNRRVEFRMVVNGAAKASDPNLTHALPKGK